MSRKRVLLVEDDASARLGLKDHLESAGFGVVEADSCKSALARYEEGDLDAVITDYALPDGNSLQLLETLKGPPGLPVIVLTGHGTIDLAVKAIQQGADQFLTKPVELPALETLLRRLLSRERDRKRVLAVQSSRSERLLDPFLGASPEMARLSAEAHKLVNTDRPILILGETGVGKGVLSAWLHRLSPRVEEPYVDLNCAGLSREFLESELFGHEKGAFTGATSAKLGLFEVAHRGTLFLDEIGDTDLEVQAKLLKVIEERRFRRMGDVRYRSVDVRIITATHHPLSQRVQEGRFRSDLYFRISALPLTIPPLRERVMDIPILARNILADVGIDLGRPGMSLTGQADAALAAYSWPGNLRELKNVLERAVLLSPHDRISPSELRFEAVVAPGSGVTEFYPVTMTLEEVEASHIQRVLDFEHGHVEHAAVRLGMARSTLYDNMRRLGIRRPG
jgi:DNA-binding NtrC family response regulator